MSFQEQRFNFSAAIYFYDESVKAAADIADESEAPSDVLAKIQTYKARADALRSEAQAAFEKEQGKDKVEPGTSELARAKFLITEGFELDEAGKNEEAVMQYAEAVDLCLKAKTNTSDPELQTKLMKVLVMKCLTLDSESDLESLL